MNHLYQNILLEPKDKDYLIENFMEIIDSLSDKFEQELNQLKEQIKSPECLPTTTVIIRPDLSRQQSDLWFFSEENLIKIYYKILSLKNIYDQLGQVYRYLINELEKELISENDIGSTSPEHPRSCYIESKRCGETICLSQTSNFRIKIGRISTAYGPGCNFLILESSMI